jgi:hypothetical protein
MVDRNSRKLGRSMRRRQKAAAKTSLFGRRFTGSQVPYLTGLSVNYDIRFSVPLWAWALLAAFLRINTTLPRRYGSLFFGIVYLSKKHLFLYCSFPVSDSVTTSHGT